MEGMRVLELANVLAGPSVGQFLAEMGATVVKVENTTTRGDVTRTWRLAADDPASDVTAYFSSCNLGKRSVALDIKDPRGLAAVHALARDADVVVASYKPGDAERLQVDYATLSALNPSLIYAQITGYGLDDPRAGYDAVIQAESGYQHMNGSSDGGGPTKMPVALMDVLAAHQVKEAVLASLWRRERAAYRAALAEAGAGAGAQFLEKSTGPGAYVGVSLLAAGVASLANQASGYLRAGVLPKRMGSDHPSICPYGTVFTCRDGGELVLAVGSDKQFVSLCTALGRPELAQDERFLTNPRRVAHRDECKAQLKGLIAQFDRPDLLETLHEAAVPVGGVNDMAAVFKQPQAEALVVRRGGGGKAASGGGEGNGGRSRGGLEGHLEAESQEQGEREEPRGLRQVAFLPVLDNSAADAADASAAAHDRLAVTDDELLLPPKYGEHSVEVLTELAGLDAASVEEMMKDGVVHQS